MRSADNDGFPDLRCDVVRLAARVQTLSSREISPLDSIVASVTMLEAGTAHNVIPDRTKIAGTLRALRLSTFEYGIERIQSMAASIGGAYRCNVTVSWDAHPIYPPTVNAPEAWDFARGVGMECAASSMHASAALCLHLARGAIS